MSPARLPTSRDGAAKPSAAAVWWPAPGEWPLMTGKSMPELIDAPTPLSSTAQSCHSDRLRRTDWAIRIPTSASTLSAPTPPIVRAVLWRAAGDGAPQCWGRHFWPSRLPYLAPTTGVTPKCQCPPLTPVTGANCTLIAQ